MTPDVAVVIATRDRPTRLAFALEALAEQTLASERFEVIVVHDGDGSQGKLKPPKGVRVRELSCASGTGPTRGRNLGWQATRAPLVAFTDDDCRPCSDWLQKLLEGAGEDLFLQGRTEPDPDEVHLLRGFARSQEVVGHNPWYPTCNMAYPRELLSQIGGLDESYEFDGEDTDLALRAMEAGAKPRYVEDAVVWHAVLTRTALGAMREALAKRTLPLLLKRHPAQRKHLYLGLFKNRSHALFCLGVAGAFIARGKPSLVCLAAAPYMHHHLEDVLVPGQRRPRTVARAVMHLPTRTLVDATDVAATVARGALTGVIVA